uniref:Vinculin n=1 Tax=Macrostomum lignano TaxID=282301 RepID=A0A1I8JDK3_9PLAT
MSPQLRQPQPQWSSSGGSKTAAAPRAAEAAAAAAAPPPKPQRAAEVADKTRVEPTGETDDLDADDYAQIDRVEHRLPPPSSTPATLTAPGQQQQQRPPASAQKPQQSRSSRAPYTSKSPSTRPRTMKLLRLPRKISLLFARLNQIMNEKDSSKKDLLDTAKAIVEASQNVTRIGNSLASRCTDLSIQGSLLRSCQKIPTIGTQLKILTAVKATTMLGEAERQQLMKNQLLKSEKDSEDPEEDMEATDMLVGNARALMDAVSQTVQVAEGASIKIRVDAGAVMKWRKRTK